MPFYELSPEALDDLQLTRDFIALDNIEAAARVIDQLFETFEQLAAWPKTGHVRTDFDFKGCALLASRFLLGRVSRSF